jgi:hypothetical protein
LRRTNSSMRRSGVPTPMNPPIIRLAPSGMMATDCSAEIVRMLQPSNCSSNRSADSPSLPKLRSYMRRGPSCKTRFPSKLNQRDW